MGQSPPYKNVVLVKYQAFSLSLNPCLVAPHNSLVLNKLEDFKVAITVAGQVCLLEYKE